MDMIVFIAKEPQRAASWLDGLASWNSFGMEKSRYTGTSEADSVGWFVNKKIREPLGLCLGLGWQGPEGKIHEHSSWKPE